MSKYNRRAIHRKNILFEMDFAAEVGAYRSLANLLLTFTSDIMDSKDDAAIEKLVGYSRLVSKKYLERVAEGRDLADDGPTTVRDKFKYLIEAAALDHDFENTQEKSN
ncbi:hypothetical protein ATCR1_15061 [Agrobacterium tumefaciens CCNWGS0286]|uniref:hypothetical protein n=1 Tax=Agrobacterium tumefaciens TaxID=358 RepID=UPI0002334654|nr:hypothetical protein [Agrobacterium tumefaciens]EHH05461.1 hypothetical protein ATCR1_15061 [Agrobacterium tumefaciens CCNWGS0286]